MNEITKLTNKIEQLEKDIGDSFNLMKKDFFDNNEDKVKLIEVLDERMTRFESVLTTTVNNMESILLNFDNIVELVKDEVIESIEKDS